MAQAKPLEQLDKIGGIGFLVIESHMQAVQQRQMNLADYQIRIVRDEISDVTLFLITDRSQGATRDYGVRTQTRAVLSAAEMGTLLARQDLPVLEQIQGANFLTVQAAVPTFRDKGLDLRYYRIELVRDAGDLVAIFTDKNAQGRVRGNAGVRPAFEVAMDPSDLHVVRSNFVR